VEGDAFQVSRPATEPDRRGQVAASKPAKHHLDVFITGSSRRRDPNTPEGRADLLGALKDIAHPRVVCEATGGYEQALVAACFTAGIEVSVVQPGRVRHFALAEGSVFCGLILSDLRSSSPVRSIAP
jgi:hypothetical protein